MTISVNRLIFHFNTEKVDNRPQDFRSKNRRSHFYCDNILIQVESLRSGATFPRFAEHNSIQIVGHICTDSLCQNFRRAFLRSNQSTIAFGSIRFSLTAGDQNSRSIRFLCVCVCIALLAIVLFRVSVEQACNGSGYTRWRSKEVCRQIFLPLLTDPLAKRGWVWKRPVFVQQTHSLCQ